MYSKNIFIKLIILCINCILIVNSSENLLNKRVKKIPHEIEIQNCIENFDVHKDKIIRTQDSRDMGAKYLNEIDLGSREECLRLCCETDNCDVFVFEEKVCYNLQYFT